MRLFAVATAMCCALAGLSLADEAQAAVRKPTSISAQTLEAALHVFAKERGVHLVYRSDVVGDRRTSGAVGVLTVNEALAQLLAGTGLTFRQLDDSTITIIPMSSAPASPDASGTRTSSQMSAKARAGLTEAEVLRLAQNRIRSAQADGSSSFPPSSETPSAVSESRMAVDEVVVVGSRLGSSVTESGQPIKVITREYIERSGAGSISQVLNSLPEVSVNASGDATQSIAGTTQIQLRGLPVGTTLVLINGRRIATSGLDTRAGAFNLATVPLEMVERIEVLPSGSSAVYGGDALGGVVNIVLSKDVSGLSGSARYGTADGYDEAQGSLAWGHTWSRASLSIMGSYSRNNSLRGGERALTADEDYRRFGGPDLRSLNGNPGTVYSLTAANLPGLNAPFAAVPAGSSGVGLTPANFAATAGIENRASNGAFSALVHPREAYGAFINGSYEIASSAELFLELFYSSSEANTVSSPHTINRNVPASNPFNPFGATVRVRHRLDGIGGSETEHTERYLRPLVGARGELGSWSWELAGWASESKLERTTARRALNLAAVDSALVSADPSAALNVFRDGPAGSESLLASLFVPDEITEFRTELRSANAFVRGPLVQLPVGTVDVLLGSEYEQGVLDFAPGTTVAVDADRDSYALFSEFKLPLWGRSTETGSREILALRGAVRYDHYSDFGGRTSPGVGLELRPWESLLLRASYAEAFRPPVLYQLFAPLTTSPSTVTDPVLNERYLVSGVVLGGNPSLAPQAGQTYTVGLVLSPRAVPELNVALTHWDIQLLSGFTSPTAQYVVDNASLFPGRVARDGTGRITRIDTTWINFGYLDEAGFDLSAGWRKRTAAGVFSPSLSAANTYRYETQAIVNVPPVDGVAIANSDGFAPRWKGNASLAWKHRDFQVAAAGRYVGKYRDYRPLTDGSFRTLGNRWWLDLNAQYDLTSSLGNKANTLAGASLAVGAVNLLDEEPEYSTFLSYDPRQDDIRGRLLYAQLRFEF